MPELRMKTPEEIAQMREKSVAQAKVIHATHAVCEELPADRLQYIRSCAADGDAKILVKCNDPLELHAFVSNWNCDRGVEPLLEVLKNRACDAGTALWLYWGNDPYFYTRYATIDDASDDEERVMFDFFRIIEHRMACNDFATSRVPFDPQPWIETKYHNATWAIRKIPAYMFITIVPTKQVT